MTATAFLIAAAVLGHARAAVIELNCSDNATCFENLANDFVRSVRQQKTVRLFDTLTVEPLGTRQARSNEGLLARILNNNAFSFDWNDYTFRIWKAQDRNDGALDLEVWESRTAKDVSEEIPKKSKSKVEEEEEEDDSKQTPKPKPKGPIRRHRAKKRIMQAVIPMLFGMKTSAAIIFAMGIVTVLTMKAFVASKLALMVTMGMAIKRLYESYSMGGLGLTSGVGLQNHPYLYSQYPIDFPSASSHAYSVSGMSPQFPEMYNPTALGTHQQNELLQHNDASAQQSQEAPNVQLLNSTRATERWDGKSKLQKLLEPIVEGIKKYMDPITNIFYSMPATFRGLSSDVTTTKTVEPDDKAKKPREILVPQPRYIAQRKMNYRKAPTRSRPKKYTELKVDLEKLKKNKDLYDYIKTKKYKYNYQNTYYYPRIKYFVNPNTFITRPKNNRLVPYKIDNIFHAPAIVPNRLYNATVIPISDWKPIVMVPVLARNISTLANTTYYVNKQYDNFNKNTSYLPNTTKNSQMPFSYFAHNASGFANNTSNSYTKKFSNLPQNYSDFSNVTKALPKLYPYFAQNASSFTNTMNRLPKMSPYYTRNFVNVTKLLPKKGIDTKNINHRAKRSLDGHSDRNILNPNQNIYKINKGYFQISKSGRGFLGFIQTLIDADPISGMINYASKYTKSAFKHSLKHSAPPKYYAITYELVMMTLDVIDGLVQVHQAMTEYFLDDVVKKKKPHVHIHSHGNKLKKKKTKTKTKPNKLGQSNLQNQNQKPLSLLSNGNQNQKPNTPYSDSKIRDKRE